MRWAIFGSGGMGREAFDIVRRCHPTADIVFVTDTGGPDIQGIAQITVRDLVDSDSVVLAVGDPGLRRDVQQRLGARRYGTVIAPSAVVSPSATIGEGSILCEGAIVNNMARLGRHTIVNVLSHISHDCRLGDFVTVSPRVSCNGWIEIDDLAFIGAGAVLRSGQPGRRMHIGTQAIVGAGAVVVKDVPATHLVKGVPAR